MGKENFFTLLLNELKRIDEIKTSKRKEKVIDGFTDDPAPRAIINGKPYRIFNSNDYLGLRFSKELKEGEKTASEKFGAGPGAVRFIAGTLRIHKELEEAIAKFHHREAAIIFSSAFAANIGVIHSLIKGQSKDSIVTEDVLVISDELNHRSIIEGIRVANLPKEQRQIFKHLDYDDLERILVENKGKYKRAIILTDGVFSMLGEYADLKKIHEKIEKYDPDYEQGIILLVDDSHGVAALGENGRGCEEICGQYSDLLVATFGKGFGADGGYVVGKKEIIDYLRESASTYIYSNPISPAVAGAALASVKLLESKKGKELIKKLNENIAFFKEKMKKAGFVFAVDSIHPIQPILIGDPIKTKELTDELFERGILVTNISYPVVPKGKDEIRVQISAVHTKEDLEFFIKNFIEASKKLQLI
ncbi:MAG: aminotransferase class I/II-fold pyridoxal phosphate-dependent enzyme [Patescibacteria group bacterium]